MNIEAITRRFLTRLTRTNRRQCRWSTVGFSLVVLLVVLMITGNNSAVASSLQQASVYCPAYTDSPLYRPRNNQINVSPDDDWQTIIQQANANTEILLTDGDYYLTQYAVVIDQPNITVRGASGNRDAVRIFGLGYGPDGQGFMAWGQNITIADLTITDIRDHAISVHPARGAARAHIYNVHLFDIGTQHIKGTSGSDSVEGVVACSSIGYTPGGVQGDYLGAIDIHNAVDWTVRDNYIYNINGDGSGCNVDKNCGTYIYGAPSIYLWNDARGSIVERNTIVDSYRGIALGLGGGHDGGVIRNNFIFRPVAGDAGIELWTATNLLVEHNTVILGGSYQGAIEYRNASNITIRNNLVSATPYDRGQNSAITLEGNITDATVNDLVGAADPHLKANSRAIGAGVASTLATDIDGDNRSGSSDVGADHYAGSVVPAKTTLISPSDSTNTGTPEYQWNAVGNASWYWLWVNDDSGTLVKKWYTAAQANCGSGSGVCSVTPSTAVSGAVRWWVLTWNDKGAGPWSDSLAFTFGSSPGQAELISPIGAVSTSTPTYRWNAVDGSSWYYLWVNDSTGTPIKTWYSATDAGCTTVPGVCSVTPTTAIQGNATWWLKTWNGIGYGPWSAPSSFQ